MLHQKYVVEKATIAQIAKELSCSKSSARSALIRAGISIRAAGQRARIGYGTKILRGRPTESTTEQKVIDTIIELRAGDMSFDKIAHILTKMGVPTKTNRRKWNGGCVRSIYLRYQHQTQSQQDSAQPPSRKI